jgi:hypothetical protein
MGKKLNKNKGAAHPNPQTLFKSGLTDWATKLADGGRAVDRKPALEEQYVRHGRPVVLARVPHALYPEGFRVA